MEVGKQLLQTNKRNKQKLFQAQKVEMMTKFNYENDFAKIYGQNKRNKTFLPFDNSFVLQTIT